MVTTSVAHRALVCPVRAAGLGATGFLPARLACSPAIGRGSRGICRRAGDRLVVRAEDSGDFDALLMKLSDKFEKLDNKPAVIGYGVGALVAFFIVEWLIHLPILDFLLGGTAQMLGLLMGPILLIRYLVDKEDLSADVEKTLAKITSLLPGMK